MNKEEYLDKCNHLLRDEKTYQKLKRDLSNRHRDKLIEVLKDLKDREVIDKNLHKNLHKN